MATRVGQEVGPGYNCQGILNGIAYAGRSARVVMAFVVSQAPEGMTRACQEQWHRFSARLPQFVHQAYDRALSDGRLVFAVADTEKKKEDSGDVSAELLAMHLCLKRVAVLTCVLLVCNLSQTLVYMRDCQE